MTDPATRRWSTATAAWAALEVTRPPGARLAGAGTAAGAGLGGTGDAR